MKEHKEAISAVTATRILLGLTLLVPGLFKAFVSTPEGVSGFLGGLGFPAPMVFAWVLILSEIIFGLAIVANYKLRFTTIPAIIIMVVAAFVVSLPNISTSPGSFLMHLALAGSYWTYGAYDTRKAR